MKTKKQKKGLYFRGKTKVSDCLQSNPLKALVYLVEVDMYKEFRPTKHIVYNTNEIRVKTLTRLGLKKRAIATANTFSEKEKSFGAHKLLIKTLLYHSEFKEAIKLSRIFALKYSHKKYVELVEIAFRAESEDLKKQRIVGEKDSDYKMKHLYRWIMTSSTIVRFRVFADLRGRDLQKKMGRWRYVLRGIFYKLFFLERSKKNRKEK